MSRNRSVSTQISNPDFIIYAESFGIKSFRSKNVSDLQKHLKTAINSKELYIIEIPIDTRVNDQLIKKLKNYWEE